jgi:hypothetical protein
VDGLTLTLTGPSVFNSLTNSFGIDSTFLTPDDPNLIDISETMFFQFNEPVLLDSVVISQFDSQDSGELLLKAAGVTLPLANGSMNIGGVFLQANGSDRVNSLMVTATGGTRGFSVDRFEVRAVPEPCMPGLIISACILFACRPRRTNDSALRKKLP